MKPEQRRSSFLQSLSVPSVINFLTSLYSRETTIQPGQTIDSTVSNLIEQLQESVKSKDWGKIDQTLRYLQKLNIPDQEKQSVINHPGRDGLTIIHHLLLNNTPINLLLTSLNIGFELLHPADLPLGSEKIGNCSPLHFAAIGNDYLKVKALKHHGHQILVLNEIGETPLITHLMYCKEPQLNIVKSLSDKSTMFSYTSAGLSSLEVAICRRLWPIANYLASNLRDVINTTDHSPIPIEEIAKLTIEANLLDYPHKLRHNLTASLRAAEKFNPIPDTSAHVERLLDGLITEKDWQGLSRAITVAKLNDFYPAVGDGIKRWLIASNHYQQEPLLKLCLNKDAPISLIKLLIDNGSLLHGYRNRDPILNRALRNRSIRLEVVNELLKSGSDPNANGSDGITNFDRASRYMRFDIMETLLDHGAIVPNHFQSKKFTSPIDQDLMQISFSEALEELFITKKSIPDEHDKTILRFFNTNPEHAFLYVNAYMGCNAVHSSLNGNALTKLYPYLIYLYRQGTIQRLADAIETTYDKRKELHGWHPNEAELFGLLNHPKDFERSPRTLNYLTSVLSGITRFINYSITVNRAMVDRWAQIGTETFSFKVLKHDTKQMLEPLGGEQFSHHPSLIERFELKKIDKFDNSSKFGSAFVLEAGSKDMEYHGRSKNRFQPKTTIFSEDVTIIPSRGCIWIYGPEYGTAVIRNSSTIFGRDLLRHPAYWYPEAIDMRSLNYDISAYVEQNFYHLLNPLLYEVDLYLDNFGYLMDHWLIFRDEYRRWKFDTSAKTAWISDDENERDYLVGAFQSEGFKWILDKLSYQVTNVAERASRGIKDNNHALAFVNPDFAPFSTYPFQIANQKQHYLEINQERLDAIQSIVDDSWDEKSLRQSGVLPFFKAGISNQAELMIIDPHDIETV